MERILGAPLLMAALMLFTGMPTQAGTLMVSAAASLTDVFREAAEHFENIHPDTAISLSFAASGVVLQQIARGAPVDLFAAADQATMDRAEQQGLLLPDSRQNFSQNILVLVASADSSLVIADISDLATAAVQRIALGNPDYVPAGRYAKTALENAGLWSALRPALIPTQSVRQILDYVARGEVDVGFVYATDAHLMPDRLRVLATIPLADPIRYPVAIIQDSLNAPAAERFVAYLLSPEGQALLARHGFGRP